MLFVTLLHHPVLNSEGETITSAVANLDIHDIARTARTYGVARFFVVTPLEDQKRLVSDIVEHWVEGPGGRRNPARREALSLVEICDDLESAQASAQGLAGSRVLLFATSARDGEGRVAWSTVREHLAGGDPVMLLFGTASGLAPEVFPMCAGTLPPIMARSSYRHLPVRSAVAVALDRLVGDMPR